MPERGKTDVRYRQILWKEMHRAVRAQCRVGLSRTYLGCGAAQLPVGRPCSAVGDCHWKPASPTGQPRELPAADDCLGKSMGVPGNPPALAKRQFDNPVGVEMVRYVVVRHGAQCIG